MDFFASQDAARRKTTLLVFYFALAVALMVLAVYAVVLGLLSYAGELQSPADWWQPEILVPVALFMLLVIGGGSLYKTCELRTGGSVVAEMLGGKRIPPNTTNLNQRRLLNVVEEMALASGMPVPPVYLLPQEPGINAFAAGHTPADAVIGVNQGTLEYLTRDELQGVVAHEFSHILNGDMRLNLRLIGLLHGLLLVAIIGYYVLRAAGSSSSNRSRREKDKEGGAGAIIILGLALMAIGYIGLFFGRLIKAAVSRQREYLADAAAVQFTRNPGGIAGALKKIGGLAAGSQMQTPEAETASHMFFGSAFRTSAINLFATHPPLVDRIRRIEPTFDGRFPRAMPLSPERVAQEAPAAPKESRIGRRRGGVLAAGARIPIDPAAVLASVGTSQPAAVLLSRDFLETLPAALATAVREPFSARSVVFALLLDPDPRIADRQLDLLRGLEGDATAGETARLVPLVRQLGAAGRLPLMELVQSTLTGLSAKQYAGFRKTVAALVEADRQISLLEFVLQQVLIEHLDRHFRLKRPPLARHVALGSVLNEAVILLSCLVHAGRTGAADRSAPERSFAQGAARLGIDPSKSPLLPADLCSLAALAGALDKLAAATPALKKQILAAAMNAAGADRLVTVEEAELLRAIAEALDCPLPPIDTSAARNKGSPS